MDTIASGQIIPSNDKKDKYTKSWDDQDLAGKDPRFSHTAAIMNLAAYEITADRPFLFFILPRRLWACTRGCRAGDLTAFIPGDLISLLFRPIPSYDVKQSKTARQVLGGDSNDESSSHRHGESVMVVGDGYVSELMQRCPEQAGIRRFGSCASYRMYLVFAVCGIQPRMFCCSSFFV